MPIHALAHAHSSALSRPSSHCKVEHRLQQLTDQHAHAFLRRAEARKQQVKASLDTIAAPLYPPSDGGYTSGSYQGYSSAGGGDAPLMQSCHHVLSHAVLSLALENGTSDAVK